MLRRHFSRGWIKLASASPCHYQSCFLFNMETAPGTDMTDNEGGIPSVTGRRTGLKEISPVGTCALD